MRSLRCVLFSRSVEISANSLKIIAEAMAIAYKGASNEIQQKLRRVVEVWRQRSVFETPIQEAVEARVDGRCADIYHRMQWLTPS